MRRALAFALGLLCPSCCLGQLTVDKPYYSRLIVTEDNQAEVTVTELVIDTLIMESSSSLQFTVPKVTMRVNHAVIRKNVEWKGKGYARDEIGSRGTNGVNLTLEVVFYELNQLVIDTRGGSGSNGQRAYSNDYNLNGQKGGRGGDGGDIHLRYRCNGFTPSIAEGKKHKAKTQSILFKCKGGSGGLGGAGASRNTVDNNGGITSTGRPGDMGDKGKDGVLTVEEM
jgi:hypothetical protein